MSVPVEKSSPPPKKTGRLQAWWGLVRVLGLPRTTLARASEARWVVPPYVLGMALSLAVWYLVVRLLPDLEAAAAGPAADPEMGPGSPGIRFGPMGPGPQPLSLDQLKEALRPEFLAIAAVVAPWIGGLWRGFLLHIGAALAGNRQPFSRSLGLAGYSMVPLWLGQLLAAGLAVALVITQPAPLEGAADGPGAAGAAMPGGMVPRGAMGPGGPMMPGMPGMGGSPGSGDSRPSFSSVQVTWTLDKLVPAPDEESESEGGPAMGPGGPKMAGPGMPPGMGPGGQSGLLDGLGRRLLGALEFFHLWHLLLLSLSLWTLTRRWGPAAWLSALFLGAWLLQAALQPEMEQVLTWIGLLR